MEPGMERGSRKAHFPAIFRGQMRRRRSAGREQLIRNSRECFCAGFRDVAQSVFQTDP